MSRCSIHTHTLRDMLKIFGNGVQDQKSLEVTVLVQNSQKTENNPNYPKSQV